MDAYQFLQSTPPLRLTLLAPKPAESSLSLWLKELGQSPHSGYCACDAYLQRQRRPTCVARSCQPAAFRYAALCQFLSNTNARADESETKQNKSRYGLGMVWLRSLLLGFCLFMRTFCAGQTFHILCELPARCFVYLHSHTHTVGESHTLIAHHRHLLLPRSSAHLSTRLVLA